MQSKDSYTICKCQPCCKNSGGNGRRVTTSVSYSHGYDENICCTQYSCCSLPPQYHPRDPIQATISEPNIRPLMPRQTSQYRLCRSIPTQFLHTLMPTFLINSAQRLLFQLSTTGASIPRPKLISCGHLALNSSECHLAYLRPLLYPQLGQSPRVWNIFRCKPISHLLPILHHLPHLKELLLCTHPHLIEQPLHVLRTVLLPLKLLLGMERVSNPREKKVTTILPRL
jgi:hypothetical protein